jgi:hypothetical protein
MTLSIGAVVVILVASVVTLGLLLILWRKLPLLSRGPRDRIVSYSLTFVVGINIIVIALMVEALALVVWHLSQ